MRLMAVIVVYGRELREVAAWEVLQRWLATDGSALGHLLVYDNSPTPRVSAAGDVPHCRYVHDPNNGGTAAAYRCAADIARKLGIEWLLLLDHDTHLPDDFLPHTIASMRQSAADESIAAFVPWVRHQPTGRIISPVCVTRAGGFRPLKRGRPLSGQPSAISSGTVLRVAALAALLPLPRELWLDYVDHWIFARLHARGLRICTLDQELLHELSVASPRTLSPARLLSVLEGEVVFHRLLGLTARLVYPWRLTARILYFAVVRPRLAGCTLRWLGSGSK